MMPVNEIQDFFQRIRDLTIQQAAKRKAPEYEKELLIDGIDLVESIILDLRRIAERVP